MRERGLIFEPRTAVLKNPAPTYSWPVPKELKTKVFMKPDLFIFVFATPKPFLKNPAASSSSTFRRKRRFASSHRRFFVFDAIFEMVDAD